jgi:hypothetical protein
LLGKKESFKNETGCSKDMIKNAARSACRSNVVLSPDHLYPSTSTSSATTDYRKHKRGSLHHNPADKGDIQMEYSSD